MSINWSKQELLRALKTQTVRADKLRPGDIVSDLGWQIHTIVKSSDGLIKALDEDQNGDVFSSLDMVEIVSRAALRPRGH